MHDDNGGGVPNAPRHRETFETTFDLSKEDQVLQTEYYLSFTPTGRRLRRRRIFYSVPSLIAIWAVGLFVGGVRNPLIIVLASLVGATLTAVLLQYPWWYGPLNRWSIRRFIDARDVSRSFGRYTFKVDETGISNQSPTGRGNHRWESIAEIGHNDDYIFVFYVNATGTPVPRKSFSSQTEADACLAFMRARVAQANREG